MGDKPPSQEQKRQWKRCDEREVDGFLDRARQGLHCKLGCGGAKCKHEDYKLHLDKPNVHPAIDGLNSNFVGDLIVASQRPSSSLFIKHMLVEQFKAKAISGVFNLQEKGEHASCGPDGIYPETGYSYNGEKDLMRYGIAYYEFPWPDMTAPENDIVLRSVQCMAQHISGGGRVLVHCHAGLGRTGLMIACYFMLSQRMPARDAIHLVRMCRPGAIQTTRQVDFCKRFESYVHRLSHTFREMPGGARVLFTDFLQRQGQVLHGEPARSLKYVPRHVHDCLKRILQLCEAANTAASAAEAMQAFAPTASPAPAAIRASIEAMNHANFAASQLEDVSLLAFLVVEWFRRLDEPFFGTAEVDLLLKAMRSPPPKASRTGASPPGTTSTAVVEGGGDAVPGGRMNTALAEAIAGLPRAKRHAAGVILSALHRLAELPEDKITLPAAAGKEVDAGDPSGFGGDVAAIKDLSRPTDAAMALRDRAYSFCAEAFAQCSIPPDGVERSHGALLGPADRKLLHEALIQWGDAVRGTYWNICEAPHDRRVVKMIATFSSPQPQAVAGDVPPPPLSAKDAAAAAAPLAGLPPATTVPSATSDPA